MINKPKNNIDIRKWSIIPIDKKEHMIRLNSTMYVVKLNQEFDLVTDGTIHRRIFEKVDSESTVKETLNSYYFNDELNLLYVNCEIPSKKFVVLYDQYREDDYYKPVFELYRDDYYYCTEIPSRYYVRNVYKNNKPLEQVFNIDDLFYAETNCYFYNYDDLFINTETNDITVSTIYKHYND